MHEVDDANAKVLLLRDLAFVHSSCTFVHFRLRRSQPLRFFVCEVGCLTVARAVGPLLAAGGLSGQPEPLCGRCASLTACDATGDALRVLVAAGRRETGRSRQARRELHSSVPQSKVRPVAAENSRTPHSRKDGNEDGRLPSSSLALR